MASYDAASNIRQALSYGLATLGVDVWGGRLQIYVLAVNLSQLLYTQYTQQPTRGRAAMVNNLRTSAFAMQLTVRTGEWCSPCHRMPFNSRNEASKRV
jgi:hypothetical protein